MKTRIYEAPAVKGSSQHSVTVLYSLGTSVADNLLVKAFHQTQYVGAYSAQCQLYIAHSDRKQQQL